MMNAEKESILDTRKDFPLTEKVVYMNNGAIAPSPLSTIKAVTDFMLKSSAEGPDSKNSSDYAISLMGELRTRVSHLINCEPEEVVLVQSTTEGLNLVANGLDWKKDDRIIVRGGTHEHYANYLPWVALEKRKGVKLSELSMSDENGNFEISDLEKSADGAKLVSLSHGLYNTGAIMPVEEVGKIAREKGALFCIDAAQTAGSVSIDVKKIGCDFMAFPGFKWLCGPTGIGVFYCSKKSAELLSPTITGGECAFLSPDKKVLAYMEPPQKFQGGFRNFPGVAGLEASMRYILRIGVGNIRKQNMKVAQVLREELGKIDGVKIYGPDEEEKRTSLVPFISEKVDSETIVSKLEQNNIVFAAREIGDGKKATRAAPHFFNTEEEAVTAVSYLKSILGQ